MLTRYLLEAGYTIALYPWPERIWGEIEEFAASPAVSAQVFPTLALPSARRGPADAVRLGRVKFSGSDRHSLFLDMAFLEGLRIAIDRFQPDLAHCHQSESDIPALFALTGRKIPTILTHHSGRIGWDLKFYDRIVFLCRYMQEDLCRRSGYPLEQTRVLYYPIADTFLAGEVVPARDRNGLVSVGRLQDAKGIDLLLEAYRRNERLRKHPLHLCGSGPNEEKYRAWAEKEDLPVVFHGRLSPAEIKAVVSRAVLLVNPSRMEGFSVALLESLACGTPVVGWAQQVRELEDWWARPVGSAFDARSQSVEELVDVLLRALEDPVLEDRSRTELSGLARESFSMERYGREMTGHYSELLHGG